MQTFIRALALGLMTPALISAPPVSAQAATPAQQQAASAFIEKLAADAFAVLRNDALSREAARARFRDLLRTNFAVDETGMRLIRRYRAPSSPVQLTPAQLEAYRAALPTFIVNTYSDRLYDFASARVTVVRTAPRGTRGDVDVYTRITDPKGGRPIDAIWQVKTSGPRPQVSNIVVNGVNVALTQEADFSAYIEKNGFDALVAFMRRST
jgi:phospholipid transport system substrate-binding protein